MIPRPSLIQWEESEAPWTEDAQIEHDLMMSRVLVEIFSETKLSERLLFRGGTALNKFYFDTPVRFSEDLDFIQRKSEPIMSIQEPLLRLMEAIPDISLEKTIQGKLGYQYFFDFDVLDPATDNRRLKIEIITRSLETLWEHVLRNYKVETSWFSGEAVVRTLTLDDMLAGKLVALYDRKKGRDLFDLWRARV